MHDKLTTSEKAALILSMAGQILSVFLWYVGHDADLSIALPWLKVIFGVAGALALDLVVVTTTMGRRAGRQSWWGASTIFAAAVFSALIALDAAGGPTLGAWNHISYPVVIVLFAQHLAAPRIDSLTRVNPAPVETLTTVKPVDVPALTVDSGVDEVVPVLDTPVMTFEEPIVSAARSYGNLRELGAALDISYETARTRLRKAGYKLENGALVEV